MGQPATEATLRATMLLLEELVRQGDTIVSILENMEGMMQTAADEREQDERDPELGHGFRRSEHTVYPPTPTK